MDVKSMLSMGSETMAPSVVPGHSQVIKGGCDVAHQRHEEERDLQNMILNEMEPVDDLIVPRYHIEVDHKGKHP